MKPKSRSSAFRILVAIGVVTLGVFSSRMPVSASEAALDTAGLKVMLENLGYEPTGGKYNNSGQEYWRIKRAGRNVTLTMDTFVRNDGLVWVYAGYWQLKDDQKFPDHVLLEALSQNNNTGYVHFSVHPDRKFTLSGSLANHNVRAVDMRKMLDEMLLMSDNTRHLWNPKYWKKTADDARPGSDEPMADAEKPEGKTEK
jgi:hypothetical protein